MSAAFVVDGSIAMAWLFCDEATPNTAALRNRLATETALVPAWWFIEITNVLAMAERKRIERDSEAPERAFTHLLALPNPSTHQLRRDLPRFSDPSNLAFGDA